MAAVIALSIMVAFDGLCLFTGQLNLLEMLPYLFIRRPARCFALSSGQRSIIHGRKRLLCVITAAQDTTSNLTGSL